MDGLGGALCGVVHVFAGRQDIPSLLNELKYVCNETNQSERFCHFAGMLEAKPLEMMGIEKLRNKVVITPQMHSLPT